MAKRSRSDRPSKALSDRGVRFRLLVDSAIDYAIFMLDTEGRVVTWNAGAERIKGYRAEEIRGRHYSCFYPEEARRAGTPAHLLEVAASQGRCEDEGWRLRKDGSRFWTSRGSRCRPEFPRTSTPWCERAWTARRSMTRSRWPRLSPRIFRWSP